VLASRASSSSALGDPGVELRPGTGPQLGDRRRRDDIALRYERVVVIALNASQQVTTRASIGICSPARPSG
jgi:hypothetical protein